MTTTFLLRLSVLAGLLFAAATANAHTINYALASLPQTDIAWTYLQAGILSILYL